MVVNLSAGNRVVLISKVCSAFKKNPNLILGASQLDDITHDHEPEPDDQLLRS
jgi:hypothetical protein